MQVHRPSTCFAVVGDIALYSAAPSERETPCHRGLLTAALGQAQAQELSTAKGWSSADISAANRGCTLAVVGPQRKAFLEKGAEQGNAGAAKEWEVVEPILNKEFGKTCSCVINDVAAKISRDQFFKDGQAAMAKALRDIVKPQAKCSRDMEAM
ncbi:hypothetical protein [Chitinimonas naiadis]